MRNVEMVETLTQLGLTLNQARAYLTLSIIGPSGAKTLSGASKITRQDIYRVMLSMEQTGIIEKVLGKPTVYRAIPIEQAALIMLGRRNAELKQLHTKTQRLVHSLENHSAEKGKQSVEKQFVIIPGKEVIIQRLGDALQKIKRSLDVVTSRERLSPALLEFRKRYEEALDRGVTIRIAAEKSFLPKTTVEVIQKLMKKTGFEVRFFAYPPEAVISIFDGAEASVTVRGVANTPKASALWSNEASFVAMAQSYFTSKWNESGNGEVEK
jgi:sugar-specific transcriptional regulator TrmB